MLSVNNLHIKHRDRDILSGVSLAVEPGCTVALMGPSGSGKTTLLKAIAGFVDAIDAGSVSFGGELWQDSHFRKPPRKRKATMMFQECAVWPHLTVEKQLGLVDKRACSSLLAQLRLCGSAHGASLSGGERQRLALGRVLLAGGPLLLLDEPFAALDHQTKAHSIALLLSHQKKTGCSIVMSTHDASDPSELGAAVFRLLESP